MKKDQFKTINYTEALKLKKERKGEFYENISHNNGSIFILNDSSFLILPLNPFSTALIVYDKNCLEEMLKTNTFPVKEKVNYFYESNKEKIENINKYNQLLLQELDDYLKLNNFTYFKQKIDLDSIYYFLKTKKSLKKYKLNFIVLLAKHIIEDHDQSLKIGLLKDKQTLNPIVSIVLVKKKEEKQVFFNLEDYVFGRSGYFGIEGLKRSLNEFMRKPDNDISVIYKLFD